MITPRKAQRIGARRWFVPLALALATAMFAPIPGAAQQQDLSVAATDPTAFLMSFNLIGDARMSYHGEEGGGFEFRVQPVIPFTAFGAQNLFRIIIPYQMSGPGAEGLKSVSLFDLVLFNESWGRWGVGPVATLSEGVSDSETRFAIGPAVGAVGPVNDRLQIGVFNQNLIGQDFAISQFQPVIAYQLGDGWALSTGDLQFVYNWDGGNWVNVPFGFEIGLVRSIADQPFRFSVGPQWNLKDVEGVPESKINFRLTMITPGD
jgi:hypothetical protein